MEHCATTGYGYVSDIFDQSELKLETTKIAVDYLYGVSSEYEAQSSDLEKELQDALTSRKELESTNEGKGSSSNVCSTL